MRIFNKPLNLLLTPGARTEITDLTDEQTKNAYETNIHMVAILSKYYERNQHYWNNSHKENPVTVEELRAITDQEYGEMLEVLKAALDEGNKRLVETEDSKKKQEEKSS